MVDDLALYVIIVFVYAVLGWACEVIYCSIPAKKFINRGFLLGPYCPIYGFGALLILKILAPFHQSWVLVFMLGMVIASLLEYITSVIMEKLFGMTWWDYSQKPLNINGRICLQNSILFGILSVALVFGIHPIIEFFLDGFTTNNLLFFYTAILIILAVDILFTLSQVLKIKEKLMIVGEDLEEIAVDNPINLSKLEKSLEKYADTDTERKELHATLETLHVFLEEQKFIRYFRAFPTMTYKKYENLFSSIREDILDPLRIRNKKNRSIIEYQLEKVIRIISKELVLMKQNWPFSGVKIVWFVLISAFLAMLCRYVISALWSKNFILDKATVGYMYRTSLCMSISLVALLPLRRGKIILQFILSGFLGFLWEDVFSTFFLEKMVTDTNIVKAITSQASIYLMWGILGVLMLQLFWHSISLFIEKRSQRRIFIYTGLFVLMYLLYSIFWHGGIFI